MKSHYLFLIVVTSLLSSLSFATSVTNFFDDEIYDSKKLDECVNSDNGGGFGLRECYYKALDDVITNVKEEMNFSNSPKYTQAWLDKKHKKIFKMCEREIIKERGDPPGALGYAEMTAYALVVFIN